MRASSMAPPLAGGRVPVTPPEQQIRFCRSFDGVRIAYASHGAGPPLIVVSCWLSHLQHDWQSPIWRHFLDDLGRFATLVRYDERGFGLSDWNVHDFSLDTRLADLEAVVASTGLSRFALLGMSGGSAVALAYAARHPQRVSRLILYGTVCGEPPKFEGEALTEEQTYRNMIRIGWAREDPEFRRVFTRKVIPDATEEQMRWFDELQRMSTSPENAVAARLGRQAVNIVDEIPNITAPTLILQATGDRSTSFDNAVQVSALIRGSRLVPLDSRNHILLAGEPSWQVFIREVREFMQPDHGRAVAKPVSIALGDLSPREIDVLRLAADGRTNEQIAAQLGLSVRTVERHLSNVYSKLGVTGKAARAAAVSELLRRDLGVAAVD
jgi:pimeloyl-ACP methyl ester carboxylesterase/DNA-binding CsgD family transcriptional regulator